MGRARLCPIGRIVKAHGVKGRLKVDYFGEDPRRFPLCGEVAIEISGELKTYEVLEAIPRPPHLILRLKGIERREEAETLLGKEILIRREALPALSEGEYYWIEILGMSVETEEGKHLGRVKGIFPTGANDVLIIEGKRQEILLPVTEEVIKHVDREREIIRVQRMEGLWEAEDEV